MVFSTDLPADDRTIGARFGTAAQNARSVAPDDLAATEC